MGRGGTAAEAVEPLNREFRIASLDPRYRIGSLVERLRQVMATLERFPPTRHGIASTLEANGIEKSPRAPLIARKERTLVPGHACTRVNAWAMENV